MSLRVNPLWAKYLAPADSATVRRRWKYSPERFRLSVVLEYEPSLTTSRTIIGVPDSEISSL